MMGFPWFVIGLIPSRDSLMKYCLLLIDGVIFGEEGGEGEVREEKYLTDTLI